MNDHDHKYELKIGVDEITWENPFDGSLEGTLDIYAECGCGRELDQTEIEHRLNTWEECADEV